MITFYVDGEDGYAPQVQIIGYDIEFNTVNNQCEVILSCWRDILSNTIDYISGKNNIDIEMPGYSSEAESVIYFSGCVIKNFTNVDYHPVIDNFSTDLIQEKVTVLLSFTFQSLHTFA